MISATDSPVFSDSALSRRINGSGKKIFVRITLEV
jgi:hypothetical protein